MSEKTADQWKHPPFAGQYDEEGWIWGRGSADCKNSVSNGLASEPAQHPHALSQLIGSLSLFENRLEEDFVPRRRG